MVEPLRFLSRAGDGVWAVDTDQRIILWNHAAEDLLGYTAEDAIGQFCYQLLAGRGMAGETACRPGCAVIEHVRQGKSPRGYDLWVRRHNGQVLPISVSIVVIQMPEADKSVAIVHIFRKLRTTTYEPLPLCICLLGNTAVWRNDGSQVGGLHWRRAKVRALLAYLALQRGQAVHRETLIETLWPDLNYLAALHNLNTTVYHLRLGLDPALEHGNESCYIHYEGDCYSLNGGARHWLDVDAFEIEIAQARRQSNSDQAIRLYWDALALYRGDLLADLGHAGAWCQGERHRLRELYLNALQELGVLREQRQDYTRASEVYLKALATDPCRESVCQQLMRLSIRRGDRATAVTHYRVLAEALQRELEVTPSHETRMIYEEAIRST
jgi:PAS domain S-box-containing protein